MGGRRAVEPEAREYRYVDSGGNGLPEVLKKVEGPWEQTWILRLDGYGMRSLKIEWCCLLSHRRTQQRKE